MPSPASLPAVDWRLVSHWPSPPANALPASLIAAEEIQPGSDDCLSSSDVPLQTPPRPLTVGGVFPCIPRGNNTSLYSDCPWRTTSRHGRLFHKDLLHVINLHSQQLSWFLPTFSMKKYINNLIPKWSKSCSFLLGEGDKIRTIYNKRGPHMTRTALKVH